MSSVKICMTVLLGINTWTDIRKKNLFTGTLYIPDRRDPVADQAGASLAGRDYFHGNRSIYNFDRFDQWRNGRIWRRIADTDNGFCVRSRRTGRDPRWGIIVVRNLLRH